MEIIGLCTFTLILFFVILPSIAIRLKCSENLQDSLKKLIKNKDKLFPFSSTLNYGVGKGLMYCPHPFTNWSLNPSYCNSVEELQHTIEGFRKTDSEDSVLQCVRKNADAYKIICIGGSATYCNYIDRYQDSWPSLLRGKIARKDALIFNFGVAGWGTFQSLVRSLVWFPVIRPQLVVFHQARNDLTFLFHGCGKEKIILPDCENIIGQFSDALSLRFPKYLLYIPFFRLIEIKRSQRLNFAQIYKPKPLSDLKGFERLNNEIIDGILFRIETLINMCEMISCKLLYVTEIERSINNISTAYADNLDNIYNRISEVMVKYPNATFFETRNLIPQSRQYFLDSHHYTKEGCELFSDIIAEQINKICLESLDGQLCKRALSN